MQMDPNYSSNLLISKILNNPNDKVDLPDPVLPTTPIFSYYFIAKLIP